LQAFFCTFFALFVLLLFAKVGYTVACNCPFIKSKKADNLALIAQKSVITTKMAQSTIKISAQIFNFWPSIRGVKEYVNIFDTYVCMRTWEACGLASGG
jgi:hypothetical protein